MLYLLLDSLITKQNRVCLTEGITRMFILKKREKIAVYEERIRTIQSLILTGFIEMPSGVRKIARLKRKIVALKKSLQVIK